MSKSPERYLIFSTQAVPESFFDFEEDDHGKRPVSPLLRLQMFCAESNRSYVFPVNALTDAA